MFIPNSCKKIVVFCSWLLLGLLVVGVFGANLAAAQTESPQLIAEQFWGDSGNEGATDLSLRDGTLYLSGIYHDSQGLLLNYDLSTETFNWSATLPTTTYNNAVYATADTAYIAGAFRPPACGALDGVGGTEPKTGFARFDTNGSLLACRSQNFYTYRGYEFYYAITANDSNNIIYAAGWGEQSGFGPVRTVLAGYNPQGNLLWKRNYGSGNNGGSEAKGAIWLDGFLYLAGMDQNNQAMLLKIDAATILPDINPNDTGSTTLTPVWSQLFNPGNGARAEAVATDGEFLYLVGRQENGPAGNTDTFIRKYNQDGVLLWHTSWGGTAVDNALGVAVTEGRVYVTGQTNSFGSGGNDIFLLELVAQDGSELSIQTWGGSGNEVAGAIGVVNDSLYLAGNTSSFGAGGSDVVLLRYQLTPPNNPEASLIVRPPTAGDIYPGDSFSLNVDLENTTNLYAAEALCSTDPALLTPQSGVFGDFFDPTYRIVGANQADPAAGTWLGAISQQNPAEPLSGNGRFATLLYTAVAPGDADVSCDPLLADRDGFSLPATAQGTTVTILPFASLVGTASYQGRNSHEGVMVTAVGPITQTSTTDTAGAFTLSNLRGGSYAVTADATRYLPACTSTTLNSGQTVTLPPTVIRGGDANDDDTINIGDATLLGANFGLTVPPADGRADINNDGRVNVLDLAILGGNYGLTGCQSW